jgi:hypothetical protein
MNVPEHWKVEGMPAFKAMRIGDVFAIPIADGARSIGMELLSPVSENTCALVHLVGHLGGSGLAQFPKDMRRCSNYYAVRIGLVDSPVVLAEDFGSNSEEIIAIFLSSPGHWPIDDWPWVGNRPVPDDVPFRAFRHSAGDIESIGDYSGYRDRLATHAEFRTLPSVTETGPGVLRGLVLFVNDLTPYFAAEDHLVLPLKQRSSYWFPR